MNIFDVEKDTHLVDFHKDVTLRDPKSADGCVEVLTSDGKKGTLSHVPIHTNTEQFSKDLRQKIGEGRIPVCLSGGLDTKDSANLVCGLKIDLANEGFDIKDERNDTGGNATRRTTLFAERVEIEKIDYATGKAEKRLLRKFF